MTWEKVTLTATQIAEQKALMNIQDRFEQLFIAAGGPKEMALFGDKGYEKDTISVYFSPGCRTICEALIALHKAEACEAPAKEDVALLVGHSDAWDLLT